MSETRQSEAATAGSGDASMDRVPEIRPVEITSKTRGKTVPGDVFALRGQRGKLVGRDSQLEEIRAAIQQSVEFKQPQLITVVGNQGTGKSRLVDELVRSLPPEISVYQGSGSEGSPRYGAIARLLRDRFRLADNASVEELIEDFRFEVQEVFGDQRVAEVLHVLGRFLDLEFPDSPFLRVLSENPEQYEHISRTVLRRFIEVDASRGPVVLVVDDLQWADDDTLSLLHELGVGLAGCPVTLLVCARPELMVRMSGWGEGVTEHLRVELRNLEPPEAEAMFRSLLSRCESIPLDIVEDAVEMTGGNPHFLDELVRLFLANGTIDADVSPWTIDIDRALETDLPITIEEAIEARIAALEGKEREVLEKGAVFGNVFWLGAVVALSRLEHVGEEQARVVSPAGPLDYNWSSAGESIRGDIAAIIEDLVERDYLLRLDDEDSTIDGDVELVFKHNLERDLIAKSTEASKLSRYHRMAAQWIETKLNARSEEQLEFLAQLYERGGELTRAAHSYLGAGERAKERYANDAAVELYKKGISLLGPDDAVLRMDALHDLGSVLDLLGRTGEAQQQFSLMLRQAWLFDHRAKGGAAHNRLGRIHRRLGEHEQAMAHMRAAHELFKAANDRRGIAGTLDDIGQIHWMRGAYSQALEFHRQSLAIRRGIGDRRSIALCLANIGRVHRETGAFKAAVRQFREAMALRREISDRVGVVQSLIDLGWVYVADESYGSGLEMFEEAKTLAWDTGDRLAQVEVLAGLGACYSALGQSEAAEARLQEGDALAQEMGSRRGRSTCRRLLAELSARLGQAEEAVGHAELALQIGQSLGSRLHVGCAHRALAEALVSRDPGGASWLDADEHYRKAMEILAGMNNELELARCYRSYARLKASQGNTAESDKLRRRSDEIFGRLHGASEAD